MNPKQRKGVSLGPMNMNTFLLRDREYKIARNTRAAEAENVKS